MPMLFDKGPRLEVEEFRLIRDIINRFCGIYFEESTLFSMERRLRARLVELGYADFRQYYQHLRYHAAAQSELENAVEVLTTNETYFFREQYQLESFRAEVLPLVRDEALARKERHVGIWSAGCSTGEEVYSLAMLIVASGLFDGWDVRIFGNDVSRRVLQVARRGVYGGASFRAMPRGYEAFFIETSEGRQVHPRIRAMCHFGHLNLLDHVKTAVVGRVDAIFCRNVLIYFDSASRKRVIRSFYDRLRPGGHLLLGHSESLLNLSTEFELVHLSRDMIYRRPGGATVAQGPRAARPASRGRLR